MKTKYLQGFAMFLLLLLLASCIGKPDDYSMRVYGYEICHIDSLGALSFFLPPAVDNYHVEYERMKDGRILLVNDSLQIYDPITSTLDNITPFGRYNYLAAPATDFSPDGNWFYYRGNGNICRINLNTLEEQTIVDSVNQNFVRPVISGNGRYLSFLNSSDAEAYPGHSGGFPYWMDLQSGIVTALSAGDLQIDKAIKYAWVSHAGNSIYYIGSDNLMWMKLDGSARNMVLSGQAWTKQSFDGRMILSQFASNLGSNVIYRDNSSMVWHNLSSAYYPKLCRAANILYYQSGTKLFRLNLESGEVKTIFSGKMFGRAIKSISHVAPSWTGNDVYFMIQYIKTDMVQPLYPL